ELRGALEVVRCAPLPAAEAKKIARKFVTDLATKSVPDTLRTLELGHEPAFARTQMTPHTGVPFMAPDAIGLICWLHGEELADRLCREIDALSDPAVEALT